MQLFHNVRIFTMDDQFSQAEAMVVDGQNILAVGNYKDLCEQYADAVMRDGHGMTVLPGFIDPHIHFLSGAFFRGSMDCTPEKAPDIEAVKRGLRHLVKKRDGKGWIIAHGYDPIRYPGHKTPTRHDLDAACPDQPAMIVHYSLHEAVLNSLALAKLGIDRATPNPRGGRIEKNWRGTPTGRLIETATGRAFSLALRDEEAHAEEVFSQKVKDAEHLLFSFGVTGIGDPAVPTDGLAFYRKLYRQGRLKLPVTAYPAADGNMFDLPTEHAGRPYVDDKEALPRIGPLKFFLDGADQAAMRLSLLQGLYSTAVTLFNVAAQRSLAPLKILLRSPSRLGWDLYIHNGVMMAETHELRACLNTGVANGHPVAIHAIGNQAIEQALNALTSVGPIYHHRIPCRIEHALFLAPKQIGAIRRAGIAIAAQAAFLVHMGTDNVPPLNGFKILPLRSLIDAGIHVAGSSDWPVVTCNPLEGIERAVTRRTIGSQVLQKQEAITVREAIGMYTREAAYLIGQTDRVGTLEPGKRADFILLSENPFEVAPDRLSQLQVEQTYLGGERVYRKAAQSHPETSSAPISLLETNAMVP